jgi:hypothetical protein
MNGPTPRGSTGGAIARPEWGNGRPGAGTPFYRTMVALLSLAVCGLLAAGLAVTARWRHRAGAWPAQATAAAADPRGPRQAVQSPPADLERPIPGAPRYTSLSQDDSRSQDPAPPTTHAEVAAMILKDRDDKLARVNASAATREDWHSRLQDKVDQWHRDLPPSLHDKVSWSPLICRATGCYWEVRESNPAVEQEFSGWLSDQPDFLGWPGERYKSGMVENADGTLSVTWVVFKPATPPGVPGPGR